MPASLNGDLAQFKLVDIMKLLSGRNKTGKLKIEELGNEGSVYFRDGKIVHAAMEETMGEQAVYDITSANSGKFKFFADEITDMQTIEVDTNKLLADCYRRLAEIEAVKKVIPSPDAVYNMVTDKFTKDVSFAPHELEIFSEIDGDRSISQIALDLKMDQLRVMKTFYKMFVAGMLEFVEQAAPPPRESVSPNVLKEIEHILIKAVGPIASVIMDDQITDLGTERQNFPKDLVPRLVESISQEITNEERRIEFQQETLSIIQQVMG